MSKLKKQLRFIFKASVSSVIMTAAFLLFLPLSVKAAPENTDYGCRFAEGSGPQHITVTAIAARQGEQCMSTIEAALDGYTLADTYNITFTDLYQVSYKVLDEPAQLVFQIPEKFQSSGHVFRILYIYRGKVTVLGDMDSSDETVTFLHDRAGAYALVYRDVPSSMPEEGKAFDSLILVDPNIPEPAFSTERLLSN